MIRAIRPLLGRLRSPASVSRAAPNIAASAGASRGLAVLAETLDAMEAELPLREAVRYTKGNVKWTVGELKAHSDALASGLVDLGFGPTQTMLVLLPEGPEKHLAQIAAARTGMVCACAEPSLASPSALPVLLDETSASVVFLEEDAQAALVEAVPELAAYDDVSGQPFYSARFPSLKLMAHTGFDLAPGVACFRHLLVYHPSPSPLPSLQAGIGDGAALGVNYKAGKDGKPVKSGSLTHADVLTKDDWPALHAIANRRYIEV